MCGFGSSSASAPTTNFSTQTTSANPQAKKMYNAAWANAQNVAQRPFTPYSNDPNAFVAPMNSTQLSAVNDIYGMQNAGQPYYEAAPGMAWASGNTSAAGLAPSYMSPYIDSVAAATMGILGQQQGQEQNKLSGDIARAGQWGNSRSGVERALLSGQQNLATANTISNLYNTGYNNALGAAQTDLSRQLQAAQGLGQAGQAGASNLLQAGTVGQQTQQAGLQALYNQFLMQQQYPFQVAQFLSSTAAGLGPGYGGTTSGYQNQQQPLSFFGNPLSDPALKTGPGGKDEPEVIGETNDGQDIYRYRLVNPDTGEVGPVQIGLMADEVQKRRPDAIGDYKGFKTVDYAKATDGAARMGGGVTERGDYADGGSVFDNLLNALSGHGYIDGSTWEGASIPSEPMDVTPALRDIPVERHPRHTMPPRHKSAPSGETAIAFNPPPGGLGLEPMPARFTPFPRATHSEIAFDPPLNGFGSEPMPSRFTPFPRREIAFNPSAGRFGDAPLPSHFTDFPHIDRREVIAFNPPAYGLGEGPRPAEFTRFGRLASGDQMASGYADGGSIADLVQAHGAMYGGMGGPEGGLVPQTQIPVAKLDAPSLRYADAPQKKSYGLGQMAEDALGLYKTGKGLYSEGKGIYDWLTTPASDNTMASQRSGEASGGIVYDATPELTHGPSNAEMPVAKLDAPELSFGSSGQAQSGGLGDMIKGAAGLAGAAKTIFDIGSTVGPAMMALSDRRLKTGVAKADGGEADLPNFDDAVKDTFRFEGGLNPRDSNGAPSNYGINQRANPDVDVKSLTPEKAKQLYHERYWNAIDADKLPRGLANVAYDTAVLSGPGRAKEFLAQSGGDPEKFMGLRENFLNGLIEKNPAKYGKYGPAWDSRNQSLRAGLDGGSAMAFAPAEDRPSNAGLAAMPPQSSDGVAPARGGLAPATEDASPAQGISGMIRGTPASGMGERALDFATSERFLVPLLTGLGAMASSGSRFLAPAMLQGLGAGAQAYMQVPKTQAETAEMAERARTQKEETAARHEMAPKIRAETMRQNIENLRASIFPTPAGNVVFLADGTMMPMGTYMDLSQQGRAPKVMGNVPNNATEVAQGTVPSLPAKEDVQTSPAIRPAIEPNVPSDLYDKKSAQKAHDEFIRRYNGGPEAETLGKDSEAYRQKTTQEALAARENSPFFKELATTLADAYKSHGLDEPGWKSTTRADIGNFANTIWRAFGGDPHEDLSKLKNATDVVNKISTLIASNRGAESGQHAYAALDTLKAAVPNLDMSKSAAAELTAQLMTLQQRAIDADAHAKLYAKDSKGSLSGAGSDFNDRQKSRYQKEQKIIKDLMLYYPDELKAMMSGNYPADKIEAALRRVYGNQLPSDMARYFAPSNP